MHHSSDLRFSARTTGVVLRKEATDALRDRRAWFVALAISLLSGPIVFLLTSNFIAGLEEQVARREVVMAHPEMAPTLVNFLQRAGATVVPATDDYQAALRSGRMQNGVVVPPADFEARLARGSTVTVDVVFDESQDKAQAVVRSTVRMLEGFNRELGVQRLIARGVSPQLLAPIAINDINLASANARGARLLFIVPWAALIVAVFGALSVAIDVSAGERERGSLEPLLANPVPTASLVLGKWAVVFAFSLIIVVLTMVGFAISMRFISGETLSALMQLQWREITIFCALLIPFAALMAAVNMLAATFGRTYKEAQTYVTYIAMAVQFAALAPVFFTVRDAPWQLFVPSIGQLTVLMKALRGEAIGALDMLIPAAVCAALAAAALAAIAHMLRRETVVFSRS